MDPQDRAIVADTLEQDTCGKRCQLSDAFDELMFSKRQGRLTIAKKPSCVLF